MRVRFPSSTTTCARRSRRETELFLEYQLREDRPLEELLTASYTFANETVGSLLWDPERVRRAFSGASS